MKQIVKMLSINENASEVKTKMLAFLDEMGTAKFVIVSNPQVGYFLQNGVPYGCWLMVIQNANGRRDNVVYYLNTPVMTIEEHNFSFRFVKVYSGTYICGCRVSVENNQQVIKCRRPQIKYAEGEDQEVAEVSFL